MPFEIVPLAAAGAVVAIASLLQAAAGFGFALVAVPLLALIDTRLVPGPALLCSLALAVTMAWLGRADADGAGIRATLPGLVAGTAAGAALIAAVPGERLPLIFGAMILAAVGFSVANRLPARTPRMLGCCGVAAGCMGTAAGIHGPPIALLYQDAPGATLRATMAAFFVVSYPIAIVALAIAGRFGTDELFAGVVLMPPVMLGWLLARPAARWLDGGYLRAAVLGIAATSGALLVARGSGAG